MKPFSQMAFLPSCRHLLLSDQTQKHLWEIGRTKIPQAPPHAQGSSLYFNNISGWLVGKLKFEKCWFRRSFSLSSLTYQKKYKTRSPIQLQLSRSCSYLHWICGRIVKDIFPSPIQGIMVGYFGKGLFF